MTIPVKQGKTALSAAEAGLLIEGLEALARENARMAEDARRLGYPTQANQIARKAQEARSLASLARSAGIKKITVQHG
jgi:hypothetical protein